MKRPHGDAQMLARLGAGGLGDDDPAWFGFDNISPGTKKPVQ